MQEGRVICGGCREPIYFEYYSLDAGRVLVHCSNCGSLFPVEVNKMVKARKAEQGKHMFLKVEHIGYGAVNDKTGVVVMGGGEFKDGQFGKRLELPVKLTSTGLEAMWTLSESAEGRLVELMGTDDTDRWLGHEVGLVIMEADIKDKGRQKYIMPFDVKKRTK